MPTKKDLLDAQSFSRRRLLTAFTSGAPGGKELEPANPLRAVIAGVALAAMVVVGGVFYGLMRPGLPDGWENNTVLLVEDTGARYVTVGGTLYPVINATSARLLLPADSYDVKTTTASALAEIPVGQTIGILGAPDDVPGSGDLVPDGWAACPVASDTAVAMPGDVTPALSSDATLVTADGDLYVVSGTYRYPLDSNADQVLRQIGLAGVAPVEVQSRWLNLFQAGTPLAPLFIEGADQGAMLGQTDLPLGAVVHPQGSTNLFVITADEQLAPLSPLAYQLYLLGTGARLGGEREVTAAEVDLPNADAPAGAADWPTDALTPVGASGSICAQLTHDANGEATTSLAVAAASPEAAGVTAAAHTGALVYASGEGSTLGTTLLIDESGVAYPLPDASSDVLARLGYTSDDVSPVPAAWTQFFDPGPELTIDAAGRTPSGELVEVPATDESGEVATPEPTAGGTAADGSGVGLLPAPVATLPALALPAATSPQQCEVGTVVFVPDAPAALAPLQALAAWGIATGEGVVVAVVDSGIDGSNAHLRDAIIGGVNLVPDDGAADGTTDVSGHGTAVAGAIAARAVDGSGVVGLAPDAQLLAVRVYRATDDDTVEAGLGPDAGRLAQGIVWAVDHGATLINVSMSDDESSPALSDAAAYAASHGVLIVASAGNRGTTTNTQDSPRYPAAYAGALSVAAADASGAVTDASIHGDHVQVSAPGQAVLTAATGGGDCVYAGNAPSSSYATAYASGAAALLAQAFPDETPAQWSYRLMATALRPNPDARDDLQGWGLIQPFTAMTFAPGSDSRGPASPFVDGASGAAPAATAAVIATETPSPWAPTRAWALAAGAVAAVVLGVFGVLALLRREPEPEAAPGDRKGLLDNKKDSAQTVAQ